MSPHLKLYFFFKILALLAASGAAYCLAQISPWALFAVLAAIAFKVLDWLGEEAWKEHLAWKALSAPFDIYGGSDGG